MIKNKQQKSTVRSEEKTICLALQGGLAHGAFTWGVLDRLVEEDNLKVDAIAATSAGAMNAAVFVYGYVKGGKVKAKLLMEKFWKKVSFAGSLSPLQPSFFEKMFGLNVSGMPIFPFTQMIESFRYTLSPYQFNFLDINPLKDIINELIDFDELNKISLIKLFINATDIKQGKSKVFSNTELTVKTLLASACFPYLMQAVVIDNNQYWDGGFSGNPYISSLIKGAKSKDVVLVRVTPFIRDEVPSNIAEITDRVNEVSFNTALIKELQNIVLINDLINHKLLKDEVKYQAVRLHSIANDEILSSLEQTSKFNADWDFLNYLKEVGRQSAEEWLNQNYNKIGVESTFTTGF